jgi:hypothetical protein
MSDQNKPLELTDDERAIIDRAKEYERSDMRLRANRELYVLIAKLARKLGLIKEQS